MATGIAKDLYIIYVDTMPTSTGCRAKKTKTDETMRIESEMPKEEIIGRIDASLLKLFSQIGKSGMKFNTPKMIQHICPLNLISAVPSIGQKKTRKLLVLHKAKIRYVIEIIMEHWTIGLLHKNSEAARM